MHSIRGKCFFDQSEKGVECGAVTDSHVVNLIPGLGVACGGGQYVGLNRVGHVAEVAAGFAVTIDINSVTLEQGSGPFGNDCSVSAIRVLTAAEDVEVAQADRGESVAAGENVGVEFVDVLCDRIGRQWLADGVFHLGQAGVVTVGRAAGRVHETLHAFVARGHQHVEKAVDVGGVTGDRVGEAAWHRTESCLVENVVDTIAGVTAVFQFADVALEESKARPLFAGDHAANLVEVALVAGGEVIEADDRLVEGKQGFQKVRADEAGDPGDEPGLWCAR